MMTDDVKRLFRQALGLAKDVPLPAEIMEQHDRYRAFRDRVRPDPRLDAAEIATIICLSWIKREWELSTPTESSPPAVSSPIKQRRKFRVAAPATPGVTNGG